jgi:hypothetical protein
MFVRIIGEDLMTHRLDDVSMTTAAYQCGGHKNRLVVRHTGSGFTIKGMHGIFI